jgi:prolyl oligopeptidase
MLPSRVALSGALIQLALTSVAVAADVAFFAPATPERAVTESLHGVTLTDRYRWLEDGKNAEVQSWTRAQHAATVSYLDRAAPPLPGMKDELTRYFDRNRTDAPFFKYGREFFKRVIKGEPQAKLFTRLDGKEILLFDPVAVDPSGKTRLGSIVPNRDGSKLAIGIYSGGSEIQDVRITNSRTGAAIGPLIKGVGGFHWARDERFAYFTPRTAESDAKQEPHRCVRHRLGGDRKDDEVLIQMQDAKNFCRVYEPEEAEVTVFETGDFWSNTIRIRPIGSRAEPKTIYSSDKFRAEATFRPDRMYFRTNQNAPNWKVMAASYAKPEAASWTALIPEQATVLDVVTVTNDWIVIQDREDVLSRLSVYDKDGKRIRELPLPVFGNVTDSAYDYATDTIYATLASHTAPYKVYSLGGKALDWNLVWQDDPPLDLSQIVAERLYVPAKDGTKIPVFIARRKDSRLDGANPTLLNGYGGFNIPVAPFYLGSYSSFINRGGILVDAGIRGGSDMASGGTSRRCSGRKQTTFDDMIAVAEWLIAQKYTQPSKLASRAAATAA